MSEYRDYENGVADVLAFMTDGSATVERDAHLPSRSGGRRRQVDVLVRGRIFGMTNATVVVDCKRRGSRIDVREVESFIAGPQVVTERTGFRLVLEQRNGHLNDHGLVGCHESMIIVTCTEDRCREPGPAVSHLIGVGALYSRVPQRL